MSELYLEESNEPDAPPTDQGVEPKQSDASDDAGKILDGAADDSDSGGKPEDAAEEEEELPDEIQYEAAVGGSSKGIATNNALRSLSRAARSFLLYEPRNQAIRDFLQEYRENMTATLSVYGPMELDIRPFEMIRDTIRTTCSSRGPLASSSTWFSPRQNSSNPLHLGAP